LTLHLSLTNEMGPDLVKYLVNFFSGLRAVIVYIAKKWPPCPHAS
jgi:hypothetical protein